MKTQLHLVLTVALLVAFQALGALYTSPFGPGDGTGSGSGIIPDANPTGWWDTRTVSDTPGTIATITVTLNLTGGWNSDLTSYLLHLDSANQTKSVTLLNRIGITGTDPFGNMGAGMNVILSGDTATDYSNIHTAPTGVLSGIYNPDNASQSLAAFNGMTANGSWTLFFADLSGSKQSTVNSWSLDLGTTAVPEPVNAALGLFAALALAGGVWKTCKRRKAKS